MKKFFALMVAVVLGVGMLAACGKTNTPSGSSASGGTASDGSTVVAPSGTALNLVLSTTDGSTKDNQVPSPWLNRTLATNLMFRSLFLGDSSLTEVSPDLAEGYEVSEDGLTYTITIKDGLKWSDGEALTAQDVIFSIEAAQNAAVVNSIYTATFAYITELSAEENLLTITLESPYASLINILGQFAILPQHSLKDADPLTLESNEFWTNPVTSGMFVVDELKVGNYFTMKLNENYEGTAPKIQNITVSFVSDYLTAAQSGTADYVYGNVPDMVEALSAMEEFNTHEVSVLFYKYFLFNMEGTDGVANEAMQNIEVRKAIMTAIDRASLASLYPNAPVLSSGVPNDNSAYNGFEYKYDVEQAKKDIIAAGYDISRPIRICYYNNDQTSIDLMNTVVYYLEQVGLTAEATLSNDGTTDLFTTRNYDLGFKGKSAFSFDEWYSEYLSTDALFSKVFGGDTAFDEPIKKLYATNDETTRDEVLKELQALEQEKIYKVPMFTVGTYVFTSSRVVLPQDVTFCNPLYNCDVDFANWELS